MKAGSFTNMNFDKYTNTDIIFMEAKDCQTLNYDLVELSVNAYNEDTGS